MKRCAKLAFRRLSQAILSSSIVAVGLPILAGDDDALQYDFQGAGSGGKKTLFNVCYAVALHRLAEEFNLPLPTFLTIDSPMKNIGNDVNKDIFLALYRYIYSLAADSLAKHS